MVLCYQWGTESDTHVPTKHLTLQFFSKHLVQRKSPLSPSLKLCTRLEYMSTMGVGGCGFNFFLFSCTHSLVHVHVQPDMYGAMQGGYMDPSAAVGGYPGGAHAGYHQYPSSSQYAHYGGPHSSSGMPSVPPPPPPPPSHQSMMSSGGSGGAGTPGPVGGEMGSTTPSQSVDGYQQVSRCTVSFLDLYVDCTLGHGNVEMVKRGREKEREG